MINTKIETNNLDSVEEQFLLGNIIKKNDYYEDTRSSQ